MFVSTKEFARIKDTVVKLAERLEKAEKELGIYKKKEESSDKYSIWNWHYAWLDGLNDQTDPSLKERIYAIEKRLGGDVKEIKFVPAKKVKKSKKGKK
jgi:hypothetical protein